MRSPLLFILYTNMCRSRHDIRYIIKYTFGPAIISLLQENESSHGPVTDDFVHWCEESYLQLNALKTKDMVSAFRRKTHMHKVTLIKGQTIEFVQSYKYLGTITDEKLNFEL